MKNDSNTLCIVAMSLGVLLSGLPLEVIRAEIAPRIGRLSMMILRHTLLGTAVDRDKFMYDMDVYGYGLGFFLWCQNNLALMDQWKNIGLVGGVELVEYSMSSDSTCRHNIMVGAACGGHLNILELLDPGSNVSDESELAEHAAIHNKPDVLQWMRKSGHWIDDNTVRIAIENDSLECLLWLFDYDYESSVEDYAVAAGSGSMRCLQYMTKTDCPWDYSACCSAARYGKINVLEFLHEHNRIRGKLVYEAAYQYDRVDVMVWAWKHEYALPGNPCQLAYAAPKCLRWLHETGYPWDQNAMCAGAALNGSLECLQYAHECGCPIGVDTFGSAVKGGSVDVLEWLLSVGCPWDESLYSIALIYNRFDSYGWLDARKHIFQRRQ